MPNNNNSNNRPNKQQQPMTSAEMAHRRMMARKRREMERKRRMHRAIVICVLLGVIIIAAIFMIVKFNSKDANNENNNLVTASLVPAGVTSSPANSPAASTGTEGIQSGEKTNSSQIPPASEENDLLKIATNREGEEKICYLTFDDGPTTSITPQILDVLRRYDVKATFFEVGSLINRNMDMARRVYEEGHLIANHSYSHEYKELYASSESFMSEVTQTYEKIKEATGEEEPFKLIRFPGGSYNAGSYGAKKQEYKKSLAEEGFYQVDWNALNGDAEGGKKNAAQLLEGLKSSAGTKQNIVVLMHDAAGKQSTVDALGSIIEWCMEQGYEFRRLDEI